MGFLCPPFDPRWRGHFVGQRVSAAKSATTSVPRHPIRSILRAVPRSDDDPIEHELIRTGTVAEFEVVDTKIEPTVGDEDWHVRISLQLPEDDVDSFAFGLIYVLGLLSFHDGRPRGYSGKFFEDDDEWTAADMLRHLEFHGNSLYFHADYVRGRCVKTTVIVHGNGAVVLETVNRGQAATRWVDRLKGKKYLQAVK